MGDSRYVHVDEYVKSLWDCNCWFCRLVTHRILRCLIKFKVETINTGEGALTQSDVDLLKELKDLKNTVEELKKAVVEIKATLADLTGPFGAYRAPEEYEKRSKRLEGEQIVVSQALPETRATGEEGLSVSISTKPEQQRPVRVVEEGRELAKVLEGVGEVLRKEKVRIIETNLTKMLNTMKLLYELRRLYPKASIETIIKILEDMKMLPPDDINLLKATVNLVEESLKENITHEENVLIMYTLLKQLGFRSEELEDEAMRTVLDVLATKRRKHIDPAMVSGENFVDKKGST